MKLFTTSQVPTVVGIVVVCLLISNIALDRIPRGYQNTEVNTCSIFNYAAGLDNCNNTPVTITQTGWPFVALWQYNFHNRTINNYQRIIDGIPLARGNFVSASLNADLLILLGLIAYVIYKRHESTIDTLIPDFTDAAADVDAPLIMSSDMLNENDLVSVDKGTTNNFSYNILANESDRVMILVSLHGNTHLHVVAVGDHSKLSLPLTEKIGGKYLRPVSLEGDFPNYFHLYCTPGKEVELLEVIQPNIMAILVDFCRNYDFEIFDDTLYVSQANLLGPQAEQTTLVGDVENLLKHTGFSLDSLGKPSAQPQAPSA